MNELMNGCIPPRGSIALCTPIVIGQSDLLLYSALYPRWLCVRVGTASLKDYRIWCPRYNATSCTVQPQLDVPVLPGAC